MGGRIGFSLPLLSGDLEIFIPDVVGGSVDRGSWAMAAASEGFLSVSLASVVEDVLKEHGTRFSDTSLASRKAEEAGKSIFMPDVLSNLILLWYI